MIWVRFDTPRGTWSKWHLLKRGHSARFGESVCGEMIGTKEGIGLLDSRSRKPPKYWPVCKLCLRRKP